MRGTLIWLLKRSQALSARPSDNSSIKSVDVRMVKVVASNTSGRIIIWKSNLVHFNVGAGRYFDELKWDGGSMQ